jgi:maleylacetoacetate isomerase/maleylpyruvate isomerase
VRALAQMVALDIAPLNNLKVRKYLPKEFGISDAGVKKWIQHWIADGFTAIEAVLSSGDTGQFCHGDTPTMADCCLIPQVFNAKRFECDLSPYPQILKVVEACREHPAFLAASPENQPDSLL